MQKRFLLLLILALVPSTSGLTLFPNDQITTNIKLEDVKITQNQIQLLITNYHNRIIDGL